MEAEEGLERDLLGWVSRREPDFVFGKDGEEWDGNELEA
jgi:hypothetical protein